MRPKQGLIKKTGKALKKASPTILSILGVVGVVTTAVLAVKATPKALEHIEDAKETKSRENGEDLTRMETVAACWRCYIPATATGIATVGCILGANVLNRRQQASLASAYALLNRTYQDYRKSVKNVFGEEGHKRVLQDMAVERESLRSTPFTPKAHFPPLHWTSVSLRKSICSTIFTLTGNLPRPSERYFRRSII